MVSPLYTWGCLFPWGLGKAMHSPWSGENLLAKCTIQVLKRVPGDRGASRQVFMFSFTGILLGKILMDSTSSHKVKPVKWFVSGTYATVCAKALLPPQESPQQQGSLIHWQPPSINRNFQLKLLLSFSQDWPGPGHLPLQLNVSPRWGNPPPTNLSPLFSWVLG